MTRFLLRITSKERNIIANVFVILSVVAGCNFIQQTIYFKALHKVAQNQVHCWHKETPIKVCVDTRNFPWRPNKTWIQPKKLLQWLSQETSASTMKILEFHPYKISVVHHLQPVDPVSRFNICNRIFWHNHASTVASQLLMINDNWFHCSGYINLQNTHHRDTENPCYLPESWHMVCCKQQNNAPAHTTGNLVQVLKAVFDEQIMSRW